MSRTEKGVAELQEKAAELAKLQAIVDKLANENEFTYESKYESEYGQALYHDWHNSSCYGEESGDDFGVNEDGSLWFPSSC